RRQTGRTREFGNYLNVCGGELDARLQVAARDDRVDPNDHDWLNGVFDTAAMDECGCSAGEPRLAGRGISHCGTPRRAQRSTRRQCYHVRAANGWRRRTA